MTVTLTPEQEAFVESEVGNGTFPSVDAVFAAALYSLPRSRAKLPPRAPRTDGIRARNLADILSEYPWAGADLDIERDHSSPRDIDL